MDIELRLVSPEVLARLKTAAGHGLYVEEALRQVGDVIHARVIHYLSGPREVAGPKGRKRSVNPGQFPVNVVTGHLRRSQRLVLPGEHGLNNHQMAFANTAVYSAVVHEGRRGNQARPFILQALWEEGPKLEEALDKFLQEKL